MPGLCGILDSEQVEGRQGMHAAGYGLPDSSGLCIVDENSGGAACARLSVLRNTKDDETTSGVRHGGDVAGEITLLAVRSAVQRALEVEVVVLANAIGDKLHDLGMSHVGEYRAEDPFESA